MADNSNYPPLGNNAMFSTGTNGDIAYQGDLVEDGVSYDLAQINTLIAAKVSTTELNAVTANVGSLQADFANIGNLIAENASITNLEADFANIGNLSADFANIGTLVAAKATITDLEAANANIGNLSADFANIGNLVAAKATITDLEAANANIGNLSADFANIGTLVAAKATITDLSATNANIGNLSADFANIGNLIANTATITDLTATNATITTLTANLATIDTLIANTATITDLTATNADITTLTANLATIDTLIANTATITDLTAANADITTLTANLATIDTLIANTATVNQLNAANANIGTLTADVASIDTLIANTATVNQLNAANANITTLTANLATIDTLIANTATVNQLNAANANIGTLTANVASIDTLIANTATVNQLNAANANITTLTADVASIDTLIANTATVNQLNAANANIGTLTADVASIDTLIANTATVNQLNAANANIGTLTADVASIDTLIANTATVNQLNAANANITTLTADVASIDTLIANTATVNQLNAANANIGTLTANVASIGTLVAAKATITELEATNANIGTLTANVASIQELTVGAITAESMSEGIELNYTVGQETLTGHIGGSGVFFPVGKQDLFPYNEVGTRIEPGAFSTEVETIGFRKLKISRVASTPWALTELQVWVGGKNIAIGKDISYSLTWTAYKGDPPVEQTTTIIDDGRGMPTGLLQIIQRRMPINKTFDTWVEISGANSYVEIDFRREYSPSLLQGIVWHFDSRSYSVTDCVIELLSTDNTLVQTVTNGSVTHNYRIQSSRAMTTGTNNQNCLFYSSRVAPFDTGFVAVPYTLTASDVAGTVVENSFTSGMTTKLSFANSGAMRVGGTSNVGQSVETLASYIWLLSEFGVDGIHSNDPSDDSAETPGQRFILKYDGRYYRCEFSSTVYSGSNGTRALFLDYYDNGTWTALNASNENDVGLLYNTTLDVELYSKSSLQTDPSGVSHSVCLNKWLSDGGELLVNPAEFKQDYRGMSVTGSGMIIDTANGIISSGVVAWNQFLANFFEALGGADFSSGTIRGLLMVNDTGVDDLDNEVDTEFASLTESFLMFYKASRPVTNDSDNTDTNPNSINIMSELGDIDMYCNGGATIVDYDGVQVPSPTYFYRGGISGISWGEDRWSRMHTTLIGKGLYIPYKHHVITSTSVLQNLLTDGPPSDHPSDYWFSLTNAGLMLGDYHFKADGSIKCSDVEVTGLTPARALIANSSGKLESHDGVTSTELGYIGTVSSNVQDQLDTLSAETGTYTFYDIKTAGFSSSSSYNWIPWHGTGESTNTSSPSGKLENCTFIAPYDGIVKKFLFRCETQLSSSFFTEISVRLYKAETNTEVPNSQVGSTISSSSTLNDDTTKTFTIIGPNGWDLVEGKLYAVRLQTSQAPVDTTATISIKYTI